MSTNAKRTDGGDKRGVIRIIRKTKQNAGFSNAAVANQKQFEQVVVRLGTHLDDPANEVLQIER
jgi:hypothetical protein